MFMSSWLSGPSVKALRRAIFLPRLSCIITRSRALSSRSVTCVQASDHEDPLRRQNASHGVGTLTNVTGRFQLDSRAECWHQSETAHRRASASRRRHDLLTLPQSHLAARPKKLWKARSASTQQVLHPCFQLLTMLRF